MPTKTIPQLQLKASVVGDENLAADNGIQTYRVTPSQLYDYIRSRIPAESYEIGNLTIVPSVGSNALTIALKNKAGNNPSSTDPIRIGFRNSTLTSGSFNLREITGALSITISSGSTLGQASGQASRIWVYLIDNAGTVELAVSHKRYRDDELVSTTAEGGAGAADSSTAIYSTTARSSVPVRCIGYIDNTQATAGTWASAGTQVQVAPFVPKAPTRQVFSSGSGTYYKPAGCRAILVRMIGGGGGGGANGGNSGSAGGNTTFGASLTANGGTGGNPNIGNYAAGGTATGGDINITGGTGESGFGSGTMLKGGDGADSYFGHGGSAFLALGSNQQGQATSSPGAGGAGNTVNSSNAGGGGGAGAYLEKLITDPDASYAYAVGALGAGGTGGTGGTTGGNGGAGLIIVEEFY